LFEDVFVAQGVAIVSFNAKKVGTTVLKKNLIITFAYRCQHSWSFGFLCLG
jgi:hypothetical protein